MPFDEQFIQDAICNHERLMNILKVDFSKDWSFCDGSTTTADVINQEVSFEGGRIDVLATFGNRKHVVIVEVKAGSAGPDEMNQLKGYVEKWQKLPLDAGVKGPEDVLGILLAEDFLNIPDASGPVPLGLLKFKLDKNKPFTRVLPDETREQTSDEPKKPSKKSELYTVQDHIIYVEDQETKNLFEDVTNLFLQDDDPKKGWLVKNPKGAHLAIHYKGRYLLALWPRKKYFLIDYTLDGRHKQDGRMTHHQPRVATSVRLTAAMSESNFQEDHPQKLASVLHGHFAGATQ